MTQKVFKMLKKYLLLALFLALPGTALAAGSDLQTGLLSVGTIFPSLGISGSLSVIDLIVGVIRIMLLLAGVIAVLFVVIGGFWYITSAGNEEQAEKGKSTLVNAIIGIIIVVLAYVIINVIVNLVGLGVA